MREFATRFLKDTSGATSIEYAMIAAGIGVVIAAVVSKLGSQVKTPFTTLQNKIN